MNATVNSETPFTYRRVVDNKKLTFIQDNVQEYLKAGARVLDIGCGHGVVSHFLGTLNFTVLGIDVSEKAVEVARRNNRLPNVSFAVKRAEDLGEDDCYDIIICSEVLEHLNDPSQLLSVIYKILKAEGKLIVTVPNGLGPREFLVTRPLIALRANKSVWNIVSKVKALLGYSGTTDQSSADNLEHIQFFSVNAVHRLAKRARFSIRRFSNANFVEDVFPFSLLTKRFSGLEKLDCHVADFLPHALTGGFFMVWQKL